MSRFINKRSGVVLAVLAAIGISVGAYAYFTSTGTGTGSASVGTASNFTITQTAPFPSNLFPGSPSQPVTITIKNNGTAAQRVGAVTVAVTPPAGCNAADFTTPNIDVNQTIAPGATINAAGSILLKETGVNQDACQGAGLTLTFTIAAGATGTTTP